MLRRFAFPPPAPLFMRVAETRSKNARFAPFARFAPVASGVPAARRSRGENFFRKFRLNASQIRIFVARAFVHAGCGDAKQKREIRALRTLRGASGVPAALSSLKMRQKSPRERFSSRGRASCSVSFSPSSARRRARQNSIPRKTAVRENCRALRARSTRRACPPRAG